MDHFVEANPESCARIGLDCGSCIQRSATSVAQICGGIESHALQQVFFQLYASPACYPMAQAFATAYKESSDSQPQPTLAFATAAA
jgi:hypothetical protein